MHGRRRSRPSAIEPSDPLSRLFQDFSSSPGKTSTGPPIEHTALNEAFRLKEDTEVRTIETRRYEMLVRVREFGEAHGHLFPESSLAGEMFGTVGTAVKELSEHAVSKMSTARGGRSTRTLAREALLDRLETISRTARAIGEDTAGLVDKFELPDPPTDQALLTAGRLFARDGEEFKGQFIAHAMPPAFLADLAHLVERFEEAIRGREADRDENTAARASIEAALTSGFAAVKKLDVLVANRLHDDPVVMAVWKRDRRVAYPWRTKAAAATPAPAVSPPAPAVPAATPAPAVAAPQAT